MASMKNFGLASSEIDAALSCALTCEGHCFVLEPCVHEVTRVNANRCKPWSQEDTEGHEKLDKQIRTT